MHTPLPPTTSALTIPAQPSRQARAAGPAHRSHTWAVLLLAAGLALTPCSRAADVREFGAVGDGETDDTEAVRRAIAGTTTGMVVFSRGDYLIRETIDIDLAETGRLGITGAEGTGRLIMAGPGPALRFTGSHEGTASPASVRPETWQSERMPRVSNLEIVGAHEEADGIEFVRTMQATVHGVLIRETRHGIVLARRNRNVLIDACHIYHNSGIGIHFDRVNLHQAIIQGSHISYNKGGGIRITGGEIRNLHITGNDIEYNYDDDADESADLWFDIREGSVAEGSIVSNTIQARPSPGGANIRMLGPERPERRAHMGLWTISGNLIGSQTTNLHLENTRGVTIAGNHIYSGMHRTLVLDRCRHIVVSGNSLDQSHNHGREHLNGITVRDSDGILLTGLILDEAGGGDADAGGAIEVFDSREVTITSCQLFEPAHRGIYVEGSRNVRIADCTVVERHGEPRMRAAIELTADNRTVIVSGNLTSPGNAGDIIAPEADAGPSPIVRDNHRAATD